MRNFIWVALLFVMGLSSAWAGSRFEIRGGEVYDTQTKLTWARCSVGQEWKEGHCSGTIKSFSFDDAQKQAGNGWRVPTKDELASLIDPDHKGFPTIDAAAFPDMDELYPWYWTSTSNGVTIAWYVDFKDGYTSGFISKGSPFAVRLVRSGQ
jgi:Protein of unknown function (DUF1566)